MPKSVKAEKADRVVKTCRDANKQATDDVKRASAAIREACSQKCARKKK